MIELCFNTGAPTFKVYVYDQLDETPGSSSDINLFERFVLNQHL